MVDTHADPSEVSLYQTAEDLSPALWDDLDSIKPVDVSFRTGLPFDPNTGYRVPFLGMNYEIDPATRKISVSGQDRKPSFQAGLVLMTYLTNASDEGLSGQMVTERELNGGEMFFKGPHVLNKAPVIERFGRDAGAMLKIAKTWARTEMQGGDAAFSAVGAAENSGRVYFLRRG